MAPDGPLVFDATAIIYLTKAGVARRLRSLDRPLLVPADVYEEVVVKGKERGMLDAHDVERLVQDGIFERVQPLAAESLAELRESLRGSDADAAVIQLAERERGAVVSDDRRVRGFASSRGLDVTGSAGLLIALVDRGELSQEEGREALDAMVAAGWWCDTGLYSRILKRLGA